MSDHSVLEPYWGLDYAYQFSHRHHFDYLGLRSISDRLAFVSDHFCSGSWAAQPIADIMHQCHRETGRIPVLCLDSNPWPVHTMVNDLEQQLNLEAWFVFNTDVRPEVSVHANLAPWPSWIVNQQLEHNYQIGRSRQHRVSFMSGTARFHRIRLWYEARALIRPEDVWVINKFSTDCLYDDCTSLSHAQWAESLLDQLPWANDPAFLDQLPTNSSVMSCGRNDHAAFSACVNITGETSPSTSQLLISEKTWKAYRSGCIVINYGMPMIVQYLRDFGFWIFEQYDRGQSCADMIPVIQELMRRDDIEHLYRCHADEINHNQRLADSASLARRMAQPAVDKLSALL